MKFVFDSGYLFKKGSKWYGTFIIPCRPSYLYGLYNWEIQSWGKILMVIIQSVGKHVSICSLYLQCVYILYFKLLEAPDRKLR